VLGHNSPALGILLLTRPVRQQGARPFMFTMDGQWGIRTPDLFWSFSGWGTWPQILLSLSDDEREEIYDWWSTMLLGVLPLCFGVLGNTELVVICLFLRKSDVFFFWRTCFLSLDFKA
jgi:hypothetical protein